VSRPTGRCAGAEHPADTIKDHRGAPRYIAPGEPQYEIAGSDKTAVSVSVTLKGCACAMALVAIELDNHHFSRPQKVDDVPKQWSVYERGGNFLLSTETQEALLQFAAGERRADLVPSEHTT
jgi:hypothetical protein